jgi:hypothetical protein
MGSDQHALLIARAACAVTVGRMSIETRLEVEGEKRQPHRSFGYRSEITDPRKDDPLRYKAGFPANLFRFLQIHAGSIEI